jgi:hypothetical protein
MKTTKVGDITVKEYDSLSDVILHASELLIHFVIESEDIPPTTNSVVPITKPVD